jgi:hypothetical protein
VRRLADLDADLASRRRPCVAQCVCDPALHAGGWFQQPDPGPIAYDQRKLGARALAVLIVRDDRHRHACIVAHTAR